MRAIEMYISRNWLWIIAGLILTEVFVKVGYAERGYVAYGGEWLILPLLLLIAEVAKEISDLVRNLFGSANDL